MSFLSAIKTYRLVWGTLSAQLVLMALFHFTLLSLLQEWLSVRDNGSITFFLLFFTACVPLLSLGILSSTVLALLSGYLIGWSSLWYYIPCYMLSSWLGYTLIQQIDRGQTLKALEHSSSLQKALSFLRLYPFISVLFLRFSPVISFGQLTALCAFTGIRKFTYLIATTLGMLPRTVLAVWAGAYVHAEFGTLTDYKLPESYRWAVVILFLFSLAGVIYLVNRSFRKTKALY